MQKLDIAQIEHELAPLLNHTTYNAFVQSDDAYKYAEVINKYALYCLYCNIEQIETIRVKYGSRGQRLRYDHFKRQDGTRETDLNCYNLVPSCHHCNSDYKGSDDLENVILNPLVDDFDTLAKFDLDIDIEKIGKFADYNICINVSQENRVLSEKAQQTIRVFNLINRYNAETTKSELKDFLRDLLFTTKFKRKGYKKLNKTEKEIKNSIFDKRKCEINKTKYGKLKKDLVNKYL